MPPRTVRVQRLALPPDQLHPGRHRRSRLPARSWARKVGRVDAVRHPAAADSGRTATPGDFAPTYYLQTDAPLYYYSFTDASIAMAYRSLPPEEQARFDPMITGFNPADMYAADHIRRVLTTFPGVFAGIGEFTIHKEFVSSKIAGETASLTEPGARPHPRLRGGGRPRRADPQRHRRAVPQAGRGARLSGADEGDLFLRHPKTTIIWAHIGLGRVVQPVQASASGGRGAHPRPRSRSSRRMLTDPRFATSTSTSPGTRSRSTWSRRRRRSTAAARSSTLSRPLPVRHRRGRAARTASVPQASTTCTRPLCAGSSRPADERARCARETTTRLFDEARRRVRAWEQAQRQRVSRRG